MYKVCIHNEHYADLIAQSETEPSLLNQKVRFMGGDLQALRKLTKDEWEEAKEKARRWQPTSR